jgi:hypothetical protein
MVTPPTALPSDAQAKAMGLFEEREHHVVGRTRHRRAY